MTTTLSSPSSTAHHVAARLIPDSWQDVKDVLMTGRHEGHRLLLHLLDQVSTKTLSLLDLGIIKKSGEEQIDFVSKLEGIALFAILADRYGIDFGMDKQTNAFITNADLFDLAQDLGIKVQRADLPWAMDVVGMDKTLHESYDLPSEILPLDILFAVANRCRDWYEETVGHAMVYAGRHRSVLPDEVIEFLKQTLISAYGTFSEERAAGIEEGLAYEAVRTTLGIAL